jgi:glycosyltransferase involved in cell wall biosynthesis
METIRTISSHAERSNCGFEIVIVDDGSPDDTWNVIRDLSRLMPNLRGIRLSRNFGKEAAIYAGLKAARGDAVIVMDGDLQHPPSLMPDMVRIWTDEGYDVVDAVKVSKEQQSVLHRTVSSVFNAIFTRLTGFDFSGASDFKLLDRRVVNTLVSVDETKRFFRGLTEWVGFRHARIPFEPLPRKAGASGWSYLRLVQLAATAITSFSGAPLHLITLAGFMFLFLSCAGILYSLSMWLSGKALPGFATVIILQFLIGSCIMISLGLVGVYLHNMYIELKARPQYIVLDTVSTVDEEPCGCVVAAEAYGSRQEASTLRTEPNDGRGWQS